jgi:hypothetical protein
VLLLGQQQSVLRHSLLLIRHWPEFLRLHWHCLHFRRSLFYLRFQRYLHFRRCPHFPHSLRFQLLLAYC